MRYVEVVVPEAEEETVHEVLAEAGVDHVATEERSPDDGAGRLLFRFPLPPEAVEDVMDTLHDAGVASGAYTVITSAEAVTTPNFQRLEERYAESGGSDDTVALEEVRASARQAMPSQRSYVLFVVFSTVIATVGLTQDSVLAVAGAMVVSPFVGAVLSTGVGGVAGDRALVVGGLRSQAVGMALAVVGAAAAAWAMRTTGVVTSVLAIGDVVQMANLLSPGLPSLLLALASGAAGALALPTALPVTLAGVAIAIALIPAAAAVGVGLAWGSPTAAVGAATLLAMNVVAVNVAVVVVLVLLGYRPKAGWSAFRPDRPPTVREAVYGVAVAAVVVAFVVGAVVPTYEQVHFQRVVDDEVRATLAAPAYEDAHVTGMRLGYGGGPLVRGETTVTVAVTGPPGERYPALAGTLADRIGERSGRNVTVEVRVEPTRRASAHDARAVHAPAST
ncbi:MAG: DUF389 domain-containing protein [Halarchaeum sp.]